MTQIGIAIVERAGEFLVGQRSDEGPLPGYHEFPGGKQQAGEGTAQTAQRECLEETGLEVSADRLLSSQSFQYEHDHLNIDFWLCKIRSSSPEKFPVSPWRWIPRDQLNSLNFPPANAELLEQLLTLDNLLHDLPNESAGKGTID